MTRDASGMPLAPGYNVDVLNLDAGAAQARILGYDDGQALLVVTYALRCWRRGEEDRAERVWLVYYPNDLTSWRVILAAAMAGVQLPAGWVTWRGVSRTRPFYARRPKTTPAWVVWGRTKEEVIHKAIEMEEIWKRTARFPRLESE